MPRTRTQSFVLKLPLRTRPAEARGLGILRAAQNIDAGVLGEALTRLDLMRRTFT
jgi:hypothetical protein